MKILLIAAILFAVLFVVSLIAPRASRRFQRSVDRTSRKGEDRAAERNDALGRATERSLKAVRHGGDKSADSGRALHERIKRLFSRERDED